MTALPFLNPQLILLGVVLVMFALFVINKIRYDIVALGALITLVLFGVISPEIMFLGFADPVIITIVSVFIFSAGLVRSGLIDQITRPLLARDFGFVTSLSLLLLITAVLSGFIANIAAISIMIPVAVRVAEKHKKPAAFFLMPLAFASIFGGLTTSIGTTSNIIIAAAREDALGMPFAFFDFLPVGGIVGIVGIVFLATIGWRLMPRRQGSSLSENLFDVKNYLTEIQIPLESNLSGASLATIRKLGGKDLKILKIIRETRPELPIDNVPEEPFHKEEGREEAETIDNPSHYDRVEEGDILLVEADSDTLQTLLDSTDITLLGSKALSIEETGASSISTMEAVLEPHSKLIGHSMHSIGFESFGMNMLAVSREHAHLDTRLADVRFRPGDILLLRGKVETLYDTIVRLGIFPLHERSLRLGTPRRVVFAFLIFMITILLVVSGALPIHLIFLLAAGLMVLTELVPVTKIYDSIDWSVVVLIGSVLGIGYAFQTTGAAETVANFVISYSGVLTPALALAAFFTFITLITNAIDNAAVAVIMAPVALLIAEGYGVSPDPFLMAVAVAASTALMSPIAGEPHAMVYGPGGYRFSDYIRLGGIITLIVIPIAYFLILYFFPL